MSSIIWLIVLFCVLCVKKVPPNTVIIIDKNSHYLKTKKSGFYLMLPGYKVTTKISSNNLTRTLRDTYETYDGKAAIISATCTYQSTDISATIESLANVRRSIDDIIKSSVYFATNNYKFSDMYTFSNSTRLTNEYKEKVFDNMRLELDEIGVVLTNFSIKILAYTTEQTSLTYFKPHVSSHDVCNTTDFSDCAPKDFGINNEDPNADPIKFY